MNNSGPFSNNPHSNNESFSIGMNNSRGFGPMGMMGRNPNFNNQMINPNNSNLSMYRNMGGERQDILNQIQNISSIEQNRINSFIEARVTYYDQEAVFRTDSIESIHPDYNHQFEFYIKPKDHCRDSRCYQILSDQRPYAKTFICQINRNAQRGNGCDNRYNR